MKKIQKIHKTQKIVKVQHIKQEVLRRKLKQKKNIQKKTTIINSYIHLQPINKTRDHSLKQIIIIMSCHFNKKVFLIYIYEIKILLPKQDLNTKPIFLNQGVIIMTFHNQCLNKRFGKLIGQREGINQFKNQHNYLNNGMDIEETNKRVFNSLFYANLI
ncbi:hypothetical protein IMG5_159840 [Ichthyophthirius multifiliis]|uniref:Uncharacterized protein n=1 Tax=Ichthyophthirius multifiliis TaxID=5932 RepID=G0QZU7_ICHMU|nr:hypothetical protein IMG5_159840 [Ichthyophthirius multifiliis]EGR29258.1 hypothetical protein IMG5_159840 [Ichthyophthirius multifiliis]|eukprot:XP_004030494.1 hypothetical protein IMG5_159840 [Ichthyophthirius multifiliis]